MIDDRVMEVYARFRILSEMNRDIAARRKNPALAAEHEARAAAFAHAGMILLGVFRGSAFDEEGSGLPVKPPREPVDEEWFGLSLRLPELAEQARPRAFTLDYDATRISAAELEAELRRSCAQNSILGMIEERFKRGPDFYKSLWGADLIDAPPAVCRDCSGRGRAWLDDDTPCRTCGGSGKAP